jgi:hypothetical protein
MPEALLICPVMGVAIPIEVAGDIVCDCGMSVWPCQPSVDLALAHFA